MLLVLFFHLYAFIFKYTYAVPSFLAQTLTHFWIAVDMFFILSGYVISLNYYQALKEKRLSYHSYLISRIARIFPAHIFIMLASLTFILAYYGLGFWGEENNWRSLFPFNKSYSSWGFVDFFKTLFLVQSWGIPTQMGWNTVAWSVSCELFAYLLFPVFIKLSSLFSKHRVLLILSAIVIYLLGLAALLFSLNKYGINHTGIVRVSFGFYMGVVIYLLSKDLPSKALDKPYSKIAYFGSIIVLLLCFLSAYYFVSFVWLIPAFAILLYFLVTKKVASPLLSSRVFVYLGKISYSFYLVHGIFLLLWHILFPLEFAIDSGEVYVLSYIFSYVIACFIASALIFHMVEEPSRKKIRQLFS